LLRRVAAAVGVVIVAVSSAALIYQAVTPAAILGHADPHGDGIAGWIPGLQAFAGPSAGSGSSQNRAPGPSPVALPPRTGVWIEMPVLGIALPLAKGDGSVNNIPLWKALVYPGTSWPGKPGNSYIYAHAQWGMFANLLYARVGDTGYIHDYGTGKVQTFHVSKVVGQIAWNDGTWLHYESSRPTLTLQTCVDWTAKGKRYVIQLT
jgi:LPXTG-site transpeptidase (sortase) family protein